MKLRIRGNTLRLRLSQIEVTAVEADGQTSDSIAFLGGDRLTYALVVAEDIDAPHASFGAGIITVSIPPATLQAWLDPSEVSIHASEPLADGEELEILVEKDFACLVPREGEDQENLFANPGKTAC
jgi:hypothetical protein